MTRAAADGMTKLLTGPCCRLQALSCSSGQWEHEHLQGPRGAFSFFLILATAINTLVVTFHLQPRVRIDQGRWVATGATHRL